MAARVGWIETSVRILQFVEKLFCRDPSLMQSALAKLKENFLGRIAIYHLRYEHPKKLILGESKLWSYFLPFVDRSSSYCIRIYRIAHSLQLCFLIDESCCILEIFTVES